ncbi:MAG: TIGR03808 family TAT-translocated repetitive protein [Alphaproteobacteria bacterium]|nr:TIGR03808 family TAT-translocated repetitive protein [Alphaproteobacteria bacterium]
MSIDRRSLIAVTALTGAAPGLAMAAPARTAAPATLGIDATTLGVRAGGGAEQTRMLQQAIDKTAGARVPLILGPGVYRTATVTLPAGAQIFGVRGATRLVLAGGSTLIAARGADHITLAGLTLDGAGRTIGEHGALIHLAQCAGVRIQDCEIVHSGGNGIFLEGVEGLVAGNRIAEAAEVAIFSRDARGLAIQSNTVQRAGNGGILVHRSTKGDDGTLVIDNRIEDVANTRGGSGQYGNAVNVFRAANVIVRGNRIARAAFSAVRGNAASNIQIAGNTATDIGEVAIYSEFDFEGAVIANNTIDGAALGVSVVNFNEGGRLAVVQGNLIRNLKPKRPAGTEPGDSAGVGIFVEADASVTGNVIENAPSAGIVAGWGRYMRDVAVTGNVVRTARYGVAVSVAGGAGAAIVTGNLIAGAARGAVVGMDHAKAVTGDLTQEPARHANLQVSGNRVR